MLAVFVTVIDKVECDIITAISLISPPTSGFALLAQPEVKTNVMKLLFTIAIRF
jgi:hypothetical protein